MARVHTQAHCSLYAHSTLRRELRMHPTELIHRLCQPKLHSRACNKPIVARTSGCTVILGASLNCSRHARISQLQLMHARAPTHSEHCVCMRFKPMSRALSYSACVQHINTSHSILSLDVSPSSTSSTMHVHLSTGLLAKNWLHCARLDDAATY
jgi:hypothetical protein